MSYIGKLCQCSEERLLSQLDDSSMERCVSQLGHARSAQPCQCILIYYQLLTVGTCPVLHDALAHKAVCFVVTAEKLQPMRQDTC